MAKKKKYYTIWEGKQTGVFDKWKTCEQYIKGYQGAKYKSFESRQDAEIAYQRQWTDYIRPKTTHSKTLAIDYRHLPQDRQPILDSIAVDAACSGNPGEMEYRGVDVRSGFEIFRLSPHPQGTNNVGEFLAIVHALALFNHTNPKLIIYTDSLTAMAWVKAKKCKTKLQKTTKNSAVFDLIDRAEKWLSTHTYFNPIVKWQTNIWGEIPADFGRK